MKYKVLSLALVIGFISCLTPAFAQRNVILIIADDLGSDYMGFDEAHLDTVSMPNVRKLLKKGVRFRNAWATPICSPTRAGLLTGRYSFRTGVGTAISGTTSAALDTSEVTIPRLLQKFSGSNIAKGHIGKWHLNPPAPNSNFIIPNKMGYDHFEGGFLGAITNYSSWTKIKNGVSSTVTNYATTETTDNAISWIKSQNNKPFFLWLAYHAPHDPFHLPPASLHSYTNLSGTASDITANPKNYYKAMAEALDREIGRLFDTLQTLQLWENTDIIFMGDNGNDSKVAQTQNTGGGAKGTIYQAGVRVPLVISGNVITNPNRATDALVNTHDLFATILELFSYSAWKTQIPSTKPVDSQSLLPILKNQLSEVRNWVFTEIFGAQNTTTNGKAIRNKTYKLMSFDNGTQKLFNLIQDPNENSDLLRTTLSATDKENYRSLCQEMTNLVGKSHCTTSVANESDALPTQEMLHIFPNPFTTHIQLSSRTGREHFEMYNVLGQLVYSGENLEAHDFSALSAGVYVLKVKDQATSILKVIKK